MPEQAAPLSCLGHPCHLDEQLHFSQLGQLASSLLCIPVSLCGGGGGSGGAEELLVHGAAIRHCPSDLRGLQLLPV